MKVLKLMSLLLLAITFVFTSCERDNIEEVIDKTEEQAPKVNNNIINKLVVSSPSGLDLGCLTVVFPFEMETVNGNTVEVTSIEDFEEVLVDSLDFVIDFAYPLTVVTEDQETIEVASIDELGELFASCIPDTGWGGDEFPAFLIDAESSCFEFVYPLDLTDLDDNTITVNTEAEFVDALAGNDILFFVFPFSISNDSIGVIEVTSAESLFEALSSCDYVGTPCDSITWGGYFGCYTFDFPVSFQMADGTVETANNLDEMNALFFSNDVINFAYPLGLINEETGESITVNSDEELEEALFACGGNVIGEMTIPSELLALGATDCYDIVFPITGIDYNGNTVTLNDLDTLLEYNDNGGLLIDLPVTIEQEVNGQTILTVVDSFEAFIGILENC